MLLLSALTIVRRMCRK